MHRPSNQRMSRIFCVIASRQAPVASIRRLHSRMYYYLVENVQVA
jgi:hypothetical protein